MPIGDLEFLNKNPTHSPLFSITSLTMNAEIMKEKIAMLDPQSS